MELLDGRVVIISGAGPGLGRDCAMTCAENGAATVVTARTIERVRCLVSEIEANGGSALGVAADITNVDDCRKVADEATDRFGRIDGLVNVAYREPDHRTFEDSDDDLANWRPIFEVNVFGTLQMTKAVLPTMKRTGGGSIVMINSMAAELPYVGLGPYTGSKAALGAITRTLALELGRYGIRVNGLHAGGMMNEPAREYLTMLGDKNGTSYDQEYAKSVAQIPLGYLPPTDEHVGTVLYMLSDLSRPLTGQAVHVNGGRWFH